jgi:hypothetical protein
MDDAVASLVLCSVLNQARCSTSCAAAPPIVHPLIVGAG